MKKYRLSLTVLILLATILNVARADKSTLVTKNLIDGPKHNSNFSAYGNIQPINYNGYVLNITPIVQDCYLLYKSVGINGLVVFRALYINGTTAIQKPFIYFYQDYAYNPKKPYQKFYLYLKGQPYGIMQFHCGNMSIRGYNKLYSWNDMSCTGAFARANGSIKMTGNCPVEPEKLDVLKSHNHFHKKMGT